MNLSIEPTKELNYQAQEQLKDLNNRLNPYLEQYDNCRNSIVETYRNWKTSANKTAIAYAEPFIEEIGISKGYLSKLNQIDKFKAEYIKLGWQDNFLDWFDSHGTEKCYLLCKAGLAKASDLHMSNEKVSLRNLKDYIKASKTVEPQEDTLSIPNDEDLFDMIKRRLEAEKGLDISDFESQLRLILISKMEKREEYKQKQLTHYISTSNNN